MIVGPLRIITQILKRADGFKNLGDVAFDFDLVPRITDFALGINNKRGPFNAHEFLAIHAFFLPHTVIFAGGAILVRGENEVQVMFGFEFIMAIRTVFGNANDLCGNGAKIWFCITEFAGFCRAARCHVLGIEIDHHRLAA